MWFYGFANNKQGPVPQQELQRLASTGAIQPMTMVWKDGMPEWKPAGTLPFLAPLLNPNNSAGLNLLLPIGPQSGLAIAAGYVGLISLLLWVIAPIGLILGILAMKDISAHPEKHGKGRAITGIVCGALGTLAILGIVLMAVTK